MTRPQQEGYAMKLMIASDLHGSAYYCEKLAEAYRREGARRLLLLGDVLYHGPRNDLPRDYDPRRTAAILNGLEGEVFGVRGNCEAEVDAVMLRFPVMGDYALIPSGDRLVFATHGHVYSPDRLPPLKDGDALLFGHTHVPENSVRGGVRVVNPGSVSIPKEGSPRGYMTLEDGLFIWKTLDGEEYDRARL